MTELKPCPFCGELPKLFDKPCYYYQCVKEKCRGQEMSWNNTKEDALASWNPRPIEDDLNNRIAELEHKLANYSAAADGHTHWCPECKMREDRIAELEKCAIVWHRFPEEKPDSRGDYYLVAMEKYVHYRDAESDSEFDKVSEVPFVRVGWWYSPGGRFEMAGTQLNGVYAWAEMPNPPEEK